MSQNTGTLVAAAIRPADSADAFPTFYAEEGKGGYYSVTTLTQRDAISPDRRTEGMRVRVTDLLVDYTLTGGIANSNWTITPSQTKQVKTVPDPTYTLTSADANNILQFTGSSSKILYVPAGLPSLLRFEARQIGTGSVQVQPVASSGVLIRVAPTEIAQTAEQYSTMAIDWIGTDEYIVYGRLTLL